MKLCCANSARGAAGSSSLAMLVVVVSLLWSPQTVSAQDKQPIAGTGHGAFFDGDGKQIPLSLGFVDQAHAWYRARLVAGLPDPQKEQFAAFEKLLYQGSQAAGQDKLLLQHQALEWLLANSGAKELGPHTANKLRALRHAMQWKLPDQADLRVQDKRAVFAPDPDVLKRLSRPELQPKAGGQLRTATVNSGQAYINECTAAGVPIPPPINLMDPAGTAGWKSQGFIPQTEQFIVGSPAELRSYRSTAPDGMCFALPRYSDSSLSTVSLDGVICMGKQSAKVCFWDNQWTNGGIVQTFPFPAGTQIPIGVPSVAGGKYQAGGKEIEFGPGGVCTDCHAGENPYIVHPLANLATSGPPVLWQSLAGAPQNLPMKPVNRYDPLVGSTWPQNKFSHDAASVPGACGGCHVKASKGRFPQLSNEISQYCSVVLAQAIVKTMPPGAGGTAAAAGNAFKNAWCGMAPVASTADAGDPHIQTTNGVHYDFQAAGEFTVLKNSDTGFELQTRQSPVLTDFIPGANAHTGLASCVSLNTAVALRVGKKRVTYQPRDGVLSGREGLEIRVDGKTVKFVSSLSLGAGNRIVKGTNPGDLDVRLADGSRVVVMPLFWESQGHWYLDVQVFDTPARAGVMGAILGGEWLPLAPDGSSFGPQPAGLPDRHVLLNQKFAEAWRVQAGTSLFNYAAGTSTKDFTDRDWPPPPNNACTKTTLQVPVPTVKEARPDLAQKACANVKDERRRANCIFDVTVMGDEIGAQGHLRAQGLKTGVK